MPIVTLIGSSIAGVEGALGATLAMCGPTAVLADHAGGLLARSSHSRWPLPPTWLNPFWMQWPGAAWVLLALPDENR
jgi:chromate transporter